MEQNGHREMKDGVSKIFVLLLILVVRPVFLSHPLLCMHVHLPSLLCIFFV